MINEIIKFMEEYEGSEKEYLRERKIEQIAERYPKILILSIYFDISKNKIGLEGGPILLASKTEGNLDEKFKELNPWLRKNHEIDMSHLEFNYYIKTMTDENKYIGSRGGLMSFSLFHFQIRKEWLYKPNQNEFILLKKVKKHKISKEAKSFMEKKLDEEIPRNILNNEEYITRVLLQEIENLIDGFGISIENIKYAQKKDILSSEDSKLSDEQIKMKSKLKKMIDCLGGAYVYLWLKDHKKVVNDLFESYVSYRIFVKRKTTRVGRCPICDHEGILGVPTSFNSAILHWKKPFNIHLTQANPFSIQICTKCAMMLNDFEKFLVEYRIRVFPLFIDDDIRMKEIEYLKSGKTCRFFDIIQHIRSLSQSPDMDFILFYKYSDILYYDYVSNYRLELGTYRHYFNEPRTSKFTLKDFRDKIENKRLIGLSQYFGKLKKVETFRKYLFYKYRQKLFDQIYRNKITLSCSDIKEIILTILDHKIQNKEIEFNKKGEKYVKNELLDFYLNSHLFARNPDKFIQNGGRNMLDEIREDKEKIIAGERPTIDSDEKFGYFLGQMTYYLIERSKASDKMGLLTPILSCKSKESLKRIVLEKYVDKYGRELSDYKDFRHRVIAETLDYLNSELESPFNYIKISFYIGFFDNNIFYEKGG